jgi:Rad3-related DNA helicase
MEEGKKYILLEAPTGSGKSAIAFTIAQMKGPAFYLAPQKFLQDQLSGDFGDQGGKHVGNLHPLIDLKGRNAYPCNWYDRFKKDTPTSKTEMDEIYRELDLGEEDVRPPGKVMCDRGECKRLGRAKLEDCKGYCPYFNRLDEAVRSEICLMNFHSFLFQTAFTGRFQNRNLLICDEGHNIEDFLMRFVEIEISDHQFVKRGIQFPELDTVQEYLNYFHEIDLFDIISEELRMARLTLDYKTEETLEHLLIKFNILQSSDHQGKWLCEWKESKSGASRRIILKPLFIDDFAHKYFFSKCNFFLIQSATILSKRAMCTALALPEDQTKMFRLGCTFPAINRPIFFCPSGPMSYHKKAQTFPKLIQDVDSICRQHSNERGIIHTHTFEIAKRLMEECSLDVRRRFLFQKMERFANNKHALMKEHKESNNSVIVAPAMHEGLDLIDDLGRFQIICKVPYPSKADPQVAARLELSSDYYEWRTATKLVQSYGRIIRHAGDTGVTYVLDENFRSFLKFSKKMLPSWFLDAIEK